MDLHLNEAGDIQRSHNGDLAVTETNWRDDLQQAYIRVMTDEGDYTLYPNMGASLSRLYGMPQSPQTGNEGRSLIISALKRDGRFEGRAINVKPVPTSPQTVRFDIEVFSGSRRRIALSVGQDLGLISEDDSGFTETFEEEFS